MLSDLQACRVLHERHHDRSSLRRKRTVFRLRYKSLPLRFDFFIRGKHGMLLTTKMTDEEERVNDARLEHAAARAPPRSVHRMVRQAVISIAHEWYTVMVKNPANSHEQENVRWNGNRGQ